MKLNNRFIFGILSLLLAAVIAFVPVRPMEKRKSSVSPSRY